MTKAPYHNPLIPSDETSEATLRRLATGIAELNGLIDDAVHRGLLQVALMFTHSREADVLEARAMIGRMGSEIPEPA